MTQFEFHYHYAEGEIVDAKECKDFPAAVKYAADQFTLLQEEGAVDPEMGKFIDVDIVHHRSGYTVGTLDRDQLYGIKFSTQFSTVNNIDNSKFVNIQLQVGHVNFIDQARDLLSLLADLSLQQFNVPDEDFPLPCTYLNVQDAKRDLQYLTEFCKIAQFQLAGDPSRHW